MRSSFQFGREVCALCLQKRKLCRSHIEPEFLYSRLYDDRHRALVFDPTRSGDSKHIKKGYREDLLCVECEQFISREYEIPFKEFWYPNDSMIPVHLVGIPDRGLHEVACSCPDRVAGFLHTILFRAGVSASRHSSSVRLGPKHEARLRRNICVRRPGIPTRIRLLYMRWETPL